MPLLGLVVVRHERNLGYGAAIRSCFNTARDLKADVVVALDTDGQHDPDQIPRLVEPIRDGVADIVVGSRFLRDSMGSKPRHPQYGRSSVA